MPNPSDDTFAASSGIALAYKLVPLEYLCTSIETYFSRGLQQRIRLMANIDATINGTSEAEEVTITWKRNLPHDLISTADAAMKLSGILSKETILKLFPSTIVPDIDEELARLEAEKPDMTIEEPIADGKNDDSEDENSAEEED